MFNMFNTRKSKEKKRRKLLNKSVSGVTISVDINLSNVGEKITLDDLSDAWFPLHHVSSEFCIQVFKGTNGRLHFISPVDNELIDEFIDIQLPMWGESDRSEDKIVVDEYGQPGLLEIKAADRPVGYIALHDILEALAGMPNVETSNALKALSGYDLEPTSQRLRSKDGMVEIPYKVSVYDCGFKFENSVSRVYLSIVS
jgi:hypothetical protein